VLGIVAEVNDFGGADEGEVKGIEEEKQPFVLVVVEGELLELVGGGDPGVGLEEGSRLADEGFSYLVCHRYIVKIDIIRLN